MSSGIGRFLWQARGLVGFSVQAFHAQQLVGLLFLGPGLELFVGSGSSGG